MNALVTAAYVTVFAYITWGVHWCVKAWGWRKCLKGTLWLFSIIMFDLACWTIYFSWGFR
jgi:hypothetical protein